MRRGLAGIVALGALLMSLSGCAESASSADEETVTVFAAASLSEVFEDLAAEFESEHDGVSVRFNFAGSSDLVSQLTEGASADVLATADESTMQDAVDAGLVDGAPLPFATNTLTIAVPAGNPAGIESFTDLASPQARVVVCAAQVPCGAAAALVQEAAGIALSPVSEELSVTDVLGKVTSGEADAGLVYKTDVIRAGDDVEEIPIDEAASVVNRYPIAATPAASETAAAFIEFVLDSRGQQLLADAGFGAA